MPDRANVIWVIGPTRSSKTSLAKGLARTSGEATPFPVIGTGDYFRDLYGQEDTYDASFVFNLSAFSARHITENKSCHRTVLESFIDQADDICIIEGERNPFVFPALYNPEKDMVFTLDRRDIAVYHNPIEPGVPAIFDLVRWGVKTGYIPAQSVVHFTFGHGRVEAHRYAGPEDDNPSCLFSEAADPRYDGDKYPWISTMIDMGQENIRTYFALEQPARHQGQNLDGPV